MQHTGYLYLPMEVSVREYDSRLLLALMAIGRGMEVILGQKWLMERNIAAVPRGLWIFKTMTLRDSGVMARARAAGHAIASIDEEVPGMGEGSGGLTWVSENAVAQCDGIFCVGAEHRKSLVQKWPDHAHRLALTGNPRWDYLRPELSSVYAAQAEKLRQEHGAFILINTNIGETNSAKYRSSNDATKRYISRGKLDTSSSENMKMWEEYLDFERANFAGVVSLVPALAEAFPSHSIIVRPHPAENIDTYKQLFAGNPRIKVIFEGPAAAWIKASDLLIHTACTTGTEAYALGKPSISYEPTRSRWHDILLSGQLSMKVSTQDGVLQAVSRLLAGPDAWRSFAGEKRAIFERFFHGSTGPLASENIISQCERILATAAPAAAPTGPWRAKFGFLPWWYLSKNNRRLFPSQSARSVEERMAGLARQLGRPITPEVSAIGDRMFKVKHKAT